MIRLRSTLKGRLVLASCLLSLATFSLLAASAQENPRPTGGQPWDLLNVDQPGMLVLYDAPEGASQTGKPLDVGDFDGDGCGDLVATGQNASFPLGDGYRNGAGHVRIAMNLCEIGGQIDMGGESPGGTVITVYGANAGDMAGTESYVADFDGDGYSDLLIGAQNSSGLQGGRRYAGAAYVVFGGPDFAARGDVDLAALPPDTMVIHGATPEDRFGIWVEGGDFDGDGIHDLLIGANQADGDQDARINAGEVWIVYGAADMIATYGQVVDLRDAAPTDATRIIGADYDDLMGSTVSGDDLNGDSLDEAIVSAGLWRGSAGIGGLSFGGGDGPGNARYNSGETFVLFGTPGLRGQTIDLALRVGPDGSPLDEGLTVIYGADANDLLGEEIAAGDVDGDGRNDLVLGAMIGDGPDNTLEDAGEAWVIYTRDPFAGRMFDLASPEAGRAAVIYPDQAFSKGGDTVRVADMDGDGFGDVVFGAPDYDPIGYDLVERPNAGMMAVLFGQEGGLPVENGRIVIPEGAPRDLRVRYVIGAEANDMMCYALAVYDVNGDGVIDLIPNGMGGDGANNDLHNAGEAYIIDGAEFLAETHDFGGGEAVTGEGTAEAAAEVEATAAALPTLTIDVSQLGDLDRGRTLYREACAGCHGFGAEGEGVGVSLIDSAFVADSSDEELLRFLQVGRPSDHPDSLTGETMPAYGGQTDWGEAELWDVIAYLRFLSAGPS